LVIGTWQIWSRFWGTRGTPLSAFKRLLVEAIGMGIRAVDTAPIYGLGRAEVVVGAALREAGDEAIVVTKVPGYAVCNGAKWVEASARRLGKPPDAVLIHWPGDAKCSAKLLDELVTRGLTRCVGLSNHSPSRTLEILHRTRRGRVDVLQFELSAARRGGLELVKLARMLGAVPMAWSPLARGLLAGSRPRGLRRLLDGVWRDPQALRIAQAVQVLANVLGVSPGRIAVEWVRHVGALPIVGARNVEQLRMLVSGHVPRKALEVLDRAYTGGDRYSEPWFSKLPGWASQILTTLTI